MYKDPKWLKEHYIEKNMRVADVASLANVPISRIERALRKNGIKKPIALARKLSWDSIGRLTDETLQKVALKYKTRGEFQDKSGSEYSTARKRGILDQICAHMEVVRIDWTDEMIRQEALKYKTRGEFQNNSLAYSPAQKRGILDQVCSHMTLQHESWDLEKVALVAKQYMERKKFAVAYPSAYVLARENGILDKICSHMQIKQIHWTPEMVFQESIKYKTRIDFQKENVNAYRAAHSLGITKKAFAHMGAAEGDSYYERELSATLKKKYPNVEKMRHTRILFRGHKIKSMEIDIYIPELRKGIEFDGRHWHGKGFKRAWTQDPTEYHKIKDDYFKSKGIEILHIKEEDWITDKEECVKKCLEFLKTE